MKKQLQATAAAAALIGSMIAPSAVLALDLGINQVNGAIQLGKQDIRTTVANIINVALSLLGIIAVVIVLLGGFQWMIAGGDPEKAAKARQLIFQGVIGIAIILSAWAIATFVIGSLLNATAQT